MAERRLVQDKVDLHFHTECSGDSYIPLFAILPMARRLSLRALAKADHDSVAGCSQLASEAAGSSIEYIPAAELSSIDDQGQTWHILGYYLDCACPELLNACEQEKGYGRLRLREQVKAWVACGGPAIGDPGSFLDQVASLRPDGEISFKQVLDHLVGRRHFASVNEAGADLEACTSGWVPPAHQPPHWRDIFDLIHTAGGLAVIAHPERPDEATVRQMIAAGADGIECQNAKVHTPDLQAFWHRICEEHHLAWTGGTDWHGPVEQWNVHTPTVAGYDTVESLKRAYHRRYGRNP